MKRAYPIGLVVLGLLLYSMHCSAIDITISSLTDGQFVDQRQDVSGSVSDPNATVVVIVHPVADSEFWVQPPIAVRNNGQWKVKAHFGRLGLDQGAEYEVRAFANPSPALKEGKYGTWPEAATARSDIVEVKRR